MDNIRAHGALHRESSLHFPQMVEVVGLRSPYESLCGKYRYRGIEPAAKSDVIPTKTHKSSNFGSRPTVHRLLSEEAPSLKTKADAILATFPTFEGLEGVGWDSQPNRKVYLFRTSRGRWVISFADEIGKPAPLCWIRSSNTSYTPVNVCDESACFEPEDSESTVSEDVPLSFEYEIATPEFGFQRSNVQIRAAGKVKSRRQNKNAENQSENTRPRYVRSYRPPLLPQLGSISPLPFPHQRGGRKGDTIGSNDVTTTAARSPDTICSTNTSRFSPRNKQSDLPDVLESPRVNYLFDVLTTPSPRSLVHSFGIIGHREEKASILHTDPMQSRNGESTVKDTNANVNRVKRGPRRKACGECSACLAPDCGKCACCINKKRKKKCVNRRCIVLKEALRLERKQRRLLLKRQRKAEVRRLSKLNAKRMKQSHGITTVVEAA